MKRHEAKRKRDREQLFPALARLIEIIPSDANARQFFQSHFVDRAEPPSAPPVDGAQPEPQEDLTIEGDGLRRLLDRLGADGCPEGAADLLRVVRRVPRSRSTETSFQVAELCFAIHQATGPVGVHERRRTAGMQATALDEAGTPVLQYYKGQRFREIAGHATGAAAADDEWRSFIRSLETALPMTLRMHRSERALEHLARSVLETGEAHAAVRAVVRPVACLPPSAHMFSCSNQAYHADRQVEYVCRTLHAASAVSFQEVVSALPVLVLDLQPHHTALEMCAAPGSKTLQALDAMLQGGWSPAVAQGVLLSNEKDRVKATQTLPARLKRYHAPNVLSTRCDATQWPRLYRRAADADDAAAPVEQQFDRIICDVPCSGDGTIRKERSVATTWAPGYVQSLVPTQKALLRRGLDLLADGGILVYSTCSLNPKEDEEVVCAGLELFGDCVELIDVNAVLRAKGATLRSAGGVPAPDGGRPQVRRSAALVRRRQGAARAAASRRHGRLLVAAFRKVRQPDSVRGPAVR
ncbi:methyltransferase, partial [Strigomonas culicis]